MTRALPQGLYVLFDPRTHSNWVDLLRGLVDVGVGIFQLRAKGAQFVQIQGWVEAARRALDKNTILILNDDIDTAVATGADGVHLGPDDEPVTVARSRGGSDMIIGVSGDDRDTIANATRLGADYFGVGAYRATTTKPDAGAPIGLAGIRRAVGWTDRPVYGIGGIAVEDCRDVRAAGARGVAVYGGVWEAVSPIEAGASYLAAWHDT